MTLLEGFVKDSKLKTDTFGLCCFSILIAEAEKDGILSHIRKYGKTLLASDSGNYAHRDGYFRCEVKLNRNDVLLFGTSGTLYWDAALIQIGELLPDRRQRTTAALQKLD